jgi:hypothetical protein
VSNEIFNREQAAGEDQLIVAFVNRDDARETPKT